MIGGRDDAIGAPIACAFITTEITMNRLLTPGLAMLAGAALCTAASNASAQGCAYQGNGSPQWGTADNYAWLYCPLGAPYTLDWPVNPTNDSQNLSIADQETLKCGSIEGRTQLSLTYQALQVPPAIPCQDQIQVVITSNVNGQIYRTTENFLIFVDSACGSGTQPAFNGQGWTCTGGGTAQ